MKMKTVLFIALLVSTILSQSAVLNSKDLAVTIYNNNLGVVKDTRTIKFSAGVSELNFTDVASTILPETVTFSALNTTNPISILQQNYENNLADKYSLLKNYIGNQVTLYTLQGQSSNVVTGTLLSYTPAFLIQTQNGVSIYDQIQGVTVANLPTSLLVKPTLVWKVQTSSALSTDFTVSYRATGFSWTATYIANLNPEQTMMDFTGWVTIDNRSGKRYENALLKLIAGDVNTATQTIRSQPIMYATMAMSAPVAPPAFESSTISDYHMYTLSRPATLNQNQKKQIEFIPKASNVSISKYEVISISTGRYAQSNIPAKNTIKFLNSKGNKLGFPLPKGTVSVNSQDSKDGSLQFVGQDSINHTPSDQNITLTTGNAFDIVANKIVNNKTQTASGYNADLTLNITNRATKQYRFEIRLTNSYGDDCNIIQNTTIVNTMWKRVNANLFNIQTSIQPNATLTINWREVYNSR